MDTPNKVTHLDVGGTSYSVDSPDCELNENHTLQTLLAGLGEAQCLIPFILSCRSLRVLEVDGLELEDLVEVLTQCPTLTALSVGVQLQEGDDLADEDVETLLPLIRNLSALNLHLSEEAYVLEVDEWTVLTIIENCPKLRSLSTDHAQDREMFLQYSSSSSSATAAAAAATITTEEVRGQDGAVSGAPWLEMLDVNILSPEALQSVVALCPQLSSLSVRSFTTEQGTNFDIDAFFAVIGQSKVEKLNLGFCKLMISKHVQCLRRLTSFSVSAEQLTNADVVGIVDRNPKLTALHLRGSPKLSKASLLYILKHCVHLTELTFVAHDPLESYGRERSKRNDMEFIYELVCMHRPTLRRECVHIEL